MLTELQARAAKLMAANRSEESYFAGGAVLNEHWKRLSDDLDVFHDDEKAIDPLVRKDVRALEDDGLDIFVDHDLWGSVEARVRDESRRETIVLWMGETRMRYFPLVADPLWGVRLHRSDLAVNKVIAAASRMKARDVADMVLVSRHHCPLGPLFLAAAAKLGRVSPLELVDRARHRTSATPNEEIEELREALDCENEGEIKTSAFVALDSAETFLLKLKESMLGGLPVNADGIPVDKVEGMASLRPVLDGGGRFPDFPESRPEFGGAGGLGGGP